MSASTTEDAPLERIAAELITQAMQGAEAAVEAIFDCLLQLEGLHDDLDAQILTRARAHLQYHDRLRQQLVPIVRLLERLDPLQGVDRPELIAELESAYTMPEQRKVHDRLLGRKHVEKDVPSVELF